VPAKIVEKNFAKWANILREIPFQSKKEEALMKFKDEVLLEEIKKLENNYEILFSSITYNTLQQYKIKYILSRLTQYIESIWNSNESESHIEQIFLNETIEHILPQKPQKEDADLFGSIEECDKYKIKLGNLAILDRNTQSIIKNKLIKEKREAYKEYAKYQLTKSALVRFEPVGVDNSKIRSYQKLKYFDKWDKDAINNRQKMLFELSKEVWKL
ncbi:MAG: HNH endonuclease, partial [Candidatus Coatesbacteria bacterium]|nr:HNH endonuclease [Candidatus Coatesbacteria bacterium]